MARAGVTPERVVDTAAEIADADGLPALTLSAVAARLGVTVPSLYKHVDGMAGVQRALAVRATDDLGAALMSAGVGKARTDALRAVCSAYRRYAVEHPGRYAATVTAPQPDDEEHRAAADRVLGTVLALLEGYRLAGDDAVDAARTVRSALHGFSALERAGGFGLPRNVDRSFDHLVAALDRALSTWPTMGRPPVHA